MERVELHLALPERADPDAADGLLSEEERERAGALLRPADRRAFTVAHALLRTALSRRRPDVPPSAWTFRTGPAGKPELDGPAVLRFNLTHADGLVACAVAGEAEIGRAHV